MTFADFDVPEVIIVARPRSGTHLLASALGSHPRIRARGECFLRYKRTVLDTGVSQQHIPFNALFRNSPRHINIGIVMYGQIRLFKECFGSLSSRRVIHLTRDPREIALSWLQMVANKRVYGKSFVAHCHVGHTPIENQPFDCDQVVLLGECIARQQKWYKERLARHSNVLTIDYSAIVPKPGGSGDIPEAASKRLTQFVGVEWQPLRTNLIRTGVCPS